tara:strand:- start:409 stop:1125 length:717 start_codon:yes stop_codon:yes gene_type:complete
MINNYIYFDWSAKGITRLIIYDNMDSNGNILSGSFYKINNDRDTFRLATISKPDGTDDNHYIQVGKNSYFSKKEASIFAYKPILNQEEINKIINIDISQELRNRFKFLNNSDKENNKVFIENINYNTLTKVKEAFDNKNDTDMTPEELKYKTIIINMKSEKDRNDATESSKDIYNEISQIVSKTLKIRSSRKYYLVEVNQEDGKRTSKMIKYISVENSNYFSNYNPSRYLKVWVRESF